MSKVYYKGFNKDMTCRGFQFKEGETYEEKEAKLCESGFHACEAPLDTFNYYDPSNSLFHKVELDGVSSERGDDSKVCAKSIKIGARLSIVDLVKAQFNYVKSNTTTEHTDPKIANAGDYGAANAGYKGAANAGNCGAANAGYKGAANAGDYGAANAGDYGAANAGNYGAANAGDKGAANAGYKGAANAGYKGAANAGNCGAANAGYKGAANAGDYGAANAGDYGAANAGNYGAANAGNYGAANAGNCGAAISGGSAAVGKKGVAVAKGVEVKAKGGANSILVVARTNMYGDVVEWKAAVVDGKKIKADTWYKLENGEFVEA